MFYFARNHGLSPTDATALQVREVISGKRFKMLYYIVQTIKREVVYALSNSTVGMTALNEIIHQQIHIVCDLECLFKVI